MARLSDVKAISQCTLENITTQLRILLVINVKKVFKNENQIYLHNDIVHTDEINPCDECGKTFNCKSYLEMHIIEYHSIDGNTPCDKCEKVFKNENQVQLHNDGVHTFEKNSL